MNKLPLICLILSLAIVNFSAQNKKTSKISGKKTPVQQPQKTVEKPITIAKSNTIFPSPAVDISLPKFETEILAELNLFRANPQDYAKYLENFLKTYNGKEFVIGERYYLQTIEGKKPVEEAIEALKQAKPLAEFKLSNGLIKAASDHAQDLVKNNRSGHRGTDGSLPTERAARYGTALMGVYENISYGTNTAREVVMTMLIDDGAASRSHRKNLLNPNLKVVGLATGENKDSGKFCVLVLTDSFIER